MTVLKTEIDVRLLGPAILFSRHQAFLPRETASAIRSQTPSTWLEGCSDLLDGTKADVTCACGNLQILYGKEFSSRHLGCKELTLCQQGKKFAGKQKHFGIFY